jgi:hypothetical protein
MTIEPVQEAPVVFTKTELRFMLAAQHYYNSGQSDLVAYSVIVKLMRKFGFTPDGTYVDQTESIPE